MRPYHLPIGFSLGILLALSAPGVGYAVLPALLALAALLYAIEMWFRERPVQRGFWIGTLILIGLGFIVTQAKLMERSDLAGALESQPNQALRVEGRIRGPLENLRWGRRAVIELESRYLFENDYYVRRNFSGVLMLHFDSDALLPSLQDGDRVRVEALAWSPTRYANPGSPDFRRLMKTKGIDANGKLRHTDGLERVEAADPGSFRSRIFAFRTQTLRRLEWLLGPDTLLPAVLLGQRAALSTETEEAFRNVGIAHLLAVSGLHLSIAALLFLPIFSRLLLLPPGPFRRINALKWAWLPTLAMVGIYALLTGLKIPVQRSAIMLGFAVAGGIIERPSAGWNGLAIAAMILLAANPLIISQPSFLLSFTSVAVLLTIASPLDQRLGRVWFDRLKERLFWARIGWYIIAILTTSLLLVFLLAPISIYFFDRFTPTGPLANLISIPLMHLFILPLGFLALFLEWLHSGWGDTIFLVADAFGRLLSQAAVAMDGWIPPSEPLPLPNLLDGSLLIATLLALEICRRRKWTRRRRWAVPALLAVATGWSYIHTPTPQQVRLTMLDVGQGDAIFLQGADGESLLIDTAAIHRSPNPIAAQTILPYLRYLKIAHLDAVFLSHLQYDHAGGASLIGQRYPTAKFFYPSSDSQTERVEAELLDRNAIAPQRRFTPCAPGRISVGAFEAEILYPFCDPSENINDGNPNNRSLVFRLCRNSDACVLFTGDIEKPVEERLAQHYGDRLKTNVLKAPHHGSAGSSSESFLRAVSPDTVLISAGERNRFGHPAPETLARYARLGIKTYRTDLDGAILGDYVEGRWRWEVAGREK